MNYTASRRLGPTDTHRRERLLEIASAITETRTAKLRWPNIHDQAVADARRELDHTGGPFSYQGITLGQQLRAHSAIARAGATFVSLPVLQDSALPSIDRSARAVWVDDAVDIGDGTIDLTKSIPHRVSAYIVVSKQLLKTAPILQASFIEAQLLSAIGAAIDYGVFESWHHGFLLSDYVAQHELAGVDITVGDMIEMEEKLSLAHGEAGTDALCWLVDPGTRKALRSVPRMEGGTHPAWPDEADSGPLGIRGVASPFAPAAVPLTSPGTVVLGRFEDLIVLQSGELEIQPNPYSMDTEGFIRVLVQGYFDLVPLNPAASFIRAVAPAPAEPEA